MNIYVGNLSFDATEADIEHAFSQYGDVKTVNIVKDRDTGRSRGFGFVEMHDRQAGSGSDRRLESEADRRPRRDGQRSSPTRRAPRRSSLVNTGNARSQHKARLSPAGFCRLSLD